MQPRQPGLVQTIASIGASPWPGRDRHRSGRDRRICTRGITFGFDLSEDMLPTMLSGGVERVARDF